jgi:hypothetical protein
VIGNWHQNQLPTADGNWHQNQQLAIGNWQNQKTRTKKQEPKSKNQKPRTKNQKGRNKKQLQLPLLR